ncbi:MAG: hypothetical protein N0C90_21515 [Candidatus Thiodiazotropha endolucinida]|nr:hypothetical protein [Candidatus Thiodiazotropha taylori]MCW4263934.1 hypothetical protein [Candidatus Thiodiazotropha endolucinida]
MSLASLTKYLRDNPVTVPSSTQDTTVIIVSDSKGSYVRKHINKDQEPERSIIWEACPGRSSEQAAIFIFRNIESWKKKYGKLLLLVWTGTCDLTCKIGDPSDSSRRKKFIDLNSTSLDHIINQYEKVLSLNDECVKVLILEVPYYSISIWNFSRGCLFSDFYRDHDLILKEKVDTLNDKIKVLNKAYGSSQVPRFSADLIACRKANKKSIKTVSYSLLLADGIHPGDDLCKHFIRRLVNTVICRLCFH